MKHIYLSWHEFEDLMAQLIFKLNTPYDTILAVARGGIIPAGMIAEALQMRNVLTASVTFTKGAMANSAFQWPNFVQFPEDSQLEGRKILVVDNLWSRGRTVSTVLGRIQAAGGYPEVAVLHWKKESSIFPDQEPDHYVEITDSFVHYPWQRIDDSDHRVRILPKLPLPTDPVPQAPVPEISN